MSTVFSGGTYVNSTCDGSSKSNLIFGGASSANIQARLTTAGWTVVSGSGTTNLLMQSAADPTTGLQMRARFKDNSGSCVQVTIENVSGSKAGTSSTNFGGNLIAGAGLTYRILASKYRFEIFQAGSVARAFVMAGLLWIPAPYQGVITEAIYMMGNSLSDGDGTIRPSFRTDWTQNQSGNVCANWCVILNGALNESGNQGVISLGAAPRLRIAANAQTSGGDQGIGVGVNAYRWHDGALDQSDALLCFGIASTGDESKIRGQLYDWTVLSDALTLDSTDSWTDGGSSHNFYCVGAHDGSSASTVRGSSWVAYS